MVGPCRIIISKKTVVLMTLGAFRFPARGWAVLGNHLWNQPVRGGDVKTCPCAGGGRKHHERGCDAGGRRAGSGPSSEVVESGIFGRKVSAHTYSNAFTYIPRA
jgi:hypothetical protein